MPTADKEGYALSRVAEKLHCRLSDGAIDPVSESAIRIFVKGHPPSTYRRFKSERGSASHMVTALFQSAEAVGAFSTREGEFYVVGILDGLIKSFDEMAAFAFSTPEFLPWLGDASKVSCQPDESANPPVGLRWKYPKYPDASYVPAPNCEFRREGARCLASLMALFVLFHEAGHIREGHCDYFGLNRENPVVTDMMMDVLAEVLSDKFVVGVLENGTEFEADDFAYISFFSDLSIKNVKREFTQLNLSYSQWVELAASAVALFHCLLCFLEDWSPQRGEFRSHPFSACRARRFISEVRSGRLTGFNRNDAEVEQGIENGILAADALARKHLSFRVLGNVIQENHEYCNEIYSLNTDTKSYIESQLSSFRISEPNSLLAWIWARILR